MFANKFTAFVDACTLASALRRNLLCSLAEAELYRIRWSTKVLDETEQAIAKILTSNGNVEAETLAQRHRLALETAFDEARIEDWVAFECVCPELPDPNDRHVVAAALKTQASVLVTENLKDFPVDLLAPLGIEVKNADSFIADSIALNEGTAIAAIQKMRLRFKKPEMTAEQLLIQMEAAGLTDTASALSSYTSSL